MPVSKKDQRSAIESIGISHPATIYWNLTPEELVEEAIKRNQGVLSDSGAVCIHTGTFTGRSPKDRYIVIDPKTEKSIDWGPINMPISPKHYDGLYRKICAYLENKDVFVRDAYACADPSYRLNIRVITEYPWSNQFVYNMFLRPEKQHLSNFSPDWTVICAPGYEADPKENGLRQENFAIINFAEKKVIIGGTGYTGEIKKGIFSVLNYLLPEQNGILPMHCSANIGKKEDTAIFFGLSGTGKTTLSADPHRYLIGDDEHGWSDKGIFNFEGGCYAKCIDLTEEKEPDIYRAIKHGAILENIVFTKGTRTPDYSDSSITQNTRVSYPIYHINNARTPSIGEHPANIFFLTADAFGVLPPISRLNPGQAMYHFISGYTAKVAGTEEGVNEPEATFSACFGAPFLPLHPTVYAEMLGEKMKKHYTRVWLINTGWTGGGYGVGSRIKLQFTRAMIAAALEGKLNDASYQKDEIFGLSVPLGCPLVPSEVLNPKKTWNDPVMYDHQAQRLARAFVSNFKKFEIHASAEIMSASPKMNQSAY